MFYPFAAFILTAAIEGCTTKSKYSFCSYYRQPLFALVLLLCHIFSAFSPKMQVWKMGGWVRKLSVAFVMHTNVPLLWTFTTCVLSFISPKVVSASEGSDIGHDVMNDATHT